MTAEKSSFSDVGSKKLIFDLAPFPMWIYELETFKFLAINKEAIKHYGFTELEFLQMTLKDIRPPEDIPLLEKAIEQTRNRKEVYKENGFFRHRKKDGTIIDVQIKSNLFVFEGKQAEIVTAIDLTDRFLQERKVANQKEQLATIGAINELLLKSNEWENTLEKCFQILRDYLKIHRICFLKGSNRELFCHPEISGLYKGANCQSNLPELQKELLAEFIFLRASEIVGDFLELHIAELPHSEIKNYFDSQEVKSMLVFPMRIDHALAGILFLEEADEKRMWMDDEIQLVKALISNLAHVVNRSQIRKELADSEARFRSLVQNGTDLIAIIDAQGQYKYIAPNSLKVLGISPEEFIGKNAFEYIHQADIHRVKKDLEQIELKSKISIDPYRFRDSQNNWRWIQTDLTNHLEDPVIAGIIANTKEVTLEVEKRMSANLLSSLTKAISQPKSLTKSLTEASKEISDLCDFSVVEIWLLSEDKSRLDLISKAGQEESFKWFYSGKNEHQNFEAGKELSGIVWDQHETHILENISQNVKYLRADVSDPVNFQTAVGIPLLYNKEFLGCIICLSPKLKKELTHQVSLLSGLGVQIGAVLKQKMTEEQYQNFFNISPDPHGLLGFDGYLKKVNKAFVKVLGYEKSELLSKPAFHFLLEEDVPNAAKRLKELIAGEPSGSFEVRFVTKERDIKWLVLRGTVIQESKIIIAAAKDITEQKEAEINLSNSNERLNRAHKIAKLGYWFRDFNRDVTEWSEETYHIHGYSPDNFIPSIENVKLTFHPEDRYLLETDPSEHIEPGKIKSFEHRIITSTNEVKWVHQEIRLLVNKEQVPYRIEGTIQDITERKENELKLAISNERFQLAIKASNEMIWEVDHQNQMIYRGAGYTDLVKYKDNENFSKDNTWCRKLQPDQIDLVWESLQKALADKEETFWAAEYKIKTENGSTAYFVDRCFILRDAQGNPVRSVGSALNVTKSRQQLERITIQNEKLREIAWLQSHVIRAPLSRIMSLVYLMKDHQGGGMAVEQIFELISASAEELDQVILEIVNKTEAVKDDDNSNPIN